MFDSIRDDVSQYPNLETKRAAREGSKSVFETEGLNELLFREPIGIPEDDPNFPDLLESSAWLNDCWTDR